MLRNRLLGAREGYTHLGITRAITAALVTLQVHVRAAQSAAGSWKSTSSRITRGSTSNGALTFEWQQLCTKCKFPRIQFTGSLLVENNPLGSSLIKRSAPVHWG